MKIPVPRMLVRGWAAFGEWGDEPVRRIDVLLAAGGVFCFAWYGWQGIIMFAVVTTLALFMRRG